jgi:hypothetical protein
VDDRHYSLSLSLSFLLSISERCPHPTPAATTSDGGFSRGSAPAEAAAEATRAEAGDGEAERCTPQLEREYVHAMYDAIAPHFSATRCGVRGSTERHYRGPRERETERPRESSHA